MKTVYNLSGDLLVTAFNLMNDNKARQALECAELALKLPGMRVIASGLKELNDFAKEADADEVDVDVDETESSDDNEEEIEIENDEIDTESSDETEETEETEEEPEEETASDDEEDEDIEDIDVETEESDSEEEPETDEIDIDDEEFAKVLSNLRAKYNVKSSIVTAAKKKARKTKACGQKCSKVKANKLPMSTMAKLRAIANKAALNN